MISLIRLGYAGTESPRYAEWKTWGPSICGMNLGPEGSDGAVRLKVDDADYRLSVHPGDDDRLRYLGWELGGALELDQACEHMSANGINVRMLDDEAARVRGVVELAEFTDIFGITHELFYGLSAEYKSYVPPRGTAGFLGHGLGHAVLVVPDAKQAQRFYARALGMQLTDVVLLKPPLGAMHFMRCNPLHHSLALLEIPGHVGLHHLMVEARDLDDVGYAYDQLGGAESPDMTTTLGRHLGDDMISFYVRSPGGFDLEYGWGERLVNEEAWAPRQFNVAGGVRGEMWGHDYLAVSPPSTIRPILSTKAEAGVSDSRESGSDRLGSDICAS